MKKIPKIIIGVAAASLTVANVISACELSVGQQVAGTYCYVTNVHGPSEFQFMFDTFWCTTQCHTGGGNCCFAFEPRGPQ